MSEPLKGFIAYSHKDTQKKDELRMRLAVMKQQNKLVTWHDGDITGGGKARQEYILKEVAASDILLYLVSAASLDSENCNKELAEALSAEIRIIPIILESCDWLNHQLSDFQALPDKGKPINEWNPESRGWQDVVDSIRKVVEEMQVQANPLSDVSKEEILSDSVFQQGNILVVLKQINKAIERYSHAIELNPNHTHAYNNRGIAYGNTGDFDRAIEDFNTAIELNSNYAIAYNSRGTVHGIKGDYDRAIVDFTKAIEQKRDYAESYYNRGNIYNNKGNSDHAIADYTKAIGFNPNYTHAYNNRGNVYYHKGDYDRAIEDHTKAIELDPNNAYAYFNRGNAYEKKGNYDRAIVDYTKAIDLDPKHAHAYGGRGVVYGKKGDYNRAIKDLNTAIEFRSDDAVGSIFYCNRGYAYGKKGDYNCAIADYTKAIELNPNYAIAYNNRGAVYREKGDFDRAIKDYTKAIELKPNYVEAYNNRGVAYDKQGAIDRAIEDYNKAIELNPDYAEPYINRGVAYDNKGDFDRAIADHNMAIKRKPNYAKAYINRGGTYGKKGDFDRAIIDFNTAVQLNPGDAAAYYNRGGAYYNKGTVDCAIEDYTKVIELKPDDTEAHNNRGVAYGEKGDYDRAIADYTKAIELKPKLAMVYSNRGEAWLHLEEWDKARADLTNARDLGVDIVASFRNDYKSVEAYERANRVKLPEDIAAMLTQPRRSRFPKTEKFLSADGTPLESPDVLNLLAKLRNAGAPLTQYIQTRPTFGLKIGRGKAFVVDGATRDQLIAEHPASADILKPFLHGRDIRRWKVAKPVDKSRSIGDSWLIFAYRRIEINRYPAIRKHLEKYRSALSKRASKQKWYELPATKSDAERFVRTKLICPNSYDHQTFAVDTEGFYCGDRCYLIPTEETWLCGLLNSRAVEWFYSQTSKQLTGDYLQARSRYMQQIPIPDLTSTQKTLIGTIVDYLIYLQGQPTTSGKDLAHARDAVMLKYFERIIDGLVYESYLPEALHQGEKQFFKPLFDERLPQIEEIQGDKMASLREIFERLYERTHPVRRNLFFLDSVKPIRIIEGKA